MMARRFYGKSNKAESQKLEGGTKDRRTWRDLAEKAKSHKQIIVPNYDNDGYVRRIFEISLKHFKFWEELKKVVGILDLCTCMSVCITYKPYPPRPRHKNKNLFLRERSI
jgi:hypothetical protein